MAAHSPECEHADPGSLCDCDCAGAHHATARTKGGVPAAGAVSRRAQKVAARDGRPAVVNRLAEPNDRTEARGATGMRVTATTRPAGLSPSTAAHAEQVRGRLPRDRDGWHAASIEAPSPEQVAAANAAVRDRQRRVDEVEAAQAAMIDTIAREQVLPELRSMGHPDTPATLESARAIAPHRAWGTPDYNALEAQRYEAQSDLRDAQRQASTAAEPQYPVDAATGLRMPAKELREHLAAVTDVGRAALADFRREADRSAGNDVRAARARLDEAARLEAANTALADLFADVRRKETGSARWRNGTPSFTDENGTRVEVATSEQRRQLLEDYQNRIRGGAADVFAARRVVAAHEQKVLHDMLAAHRGFGGVTHHDVTGGIDTADANGRSLPARHDWRERLTVAEQHFPDAWLRRSADGGPMTIGSAERAYQRAAAGQHRAHLAMSVESQDGHRYDGGFADYTDEVTVHELGHRMETMVPGLTHLEFALVRKHGVEAGGGVQRVEQMSGYDAGEVGQPDRWTAAYTGKSYESRSSLAPGDSAWELFQVGLQDTFGRSGRRYGHRDDPDELQAFVIGALLTLG